MVKGNRPLINVSDVRAKGERALLKEKPTLCVTMEGEIDKPIVSRPGIKCKGKCAKEHRSKLSRPRREREKPVLLLND
jgi:hypothetical protein